MSQERLTTHDNALAINWSNYLIMTHRGQLDQSPSNSCISHLLKITAQKTRMYSHAQYRGRVLKRGGGGPCTRAGAMWAWKKHKGRVPSQLSLVTCIHLFEHGRKVREGERMERVRSGENVCERKRERERSGLPVLFSLAFFGCWTYLVLLFYIWRYALRASSSC